MGVSPWTTRVIAEYCTSGEYEAHVPRMIEIHRRKRDAMLAAMDERCSRYALERAEGRVLRLGGARRERRSGRLRITANEEAVGYVGGEAFFAGGDGANFVRLCYSNVAERDISEAIMRFGRALERAARD